MSVGEIIQTRGRADEYITKGNQRGSGGKDFSEYINQAVSMKVHEHIIYAKTDDMLYSGGNGTGLSFYIKYAEDSTEDDPTVIAKGVDENGQEFERKIHINRINPQYATVVEMRALEAYLGVDKNGGLSSLPPESGNMGLNERRNFIKMFQQQIKDMNLLMEKKAAAYYQYSMQEYLKFWLRLGE